jgi:hypothetical protein
VNTRQSRIWVNICLYSLCSFARTNPLPESAVVMASILERFRQRRFRPERKLVLLHQDSLHGYVCSWCGCKFPKINVLNDVSLFEQIRLSKVHQEKQFAAHVCLERPPDTR